MKPSKCGRYETDGHYIRMKKPANESMTVFIPLEQILEDPHNPRRQFPKEAIQELAQSIQTHGLQTPPNVQFYRNQNGMTQFHLLAGARRTRAHHLLEAEVMECIVRPGKYDGTKTPERILKQTAENACREGHTHAEIVNVVKMVVGDEKKKKSAGAIERALKIVADSFGKSVAWARSYHTLGNLNTNLVHMLDVDEDGERLSFQIGIALASVDKTVQRDILDKSKSAKERGGFAGQRAFIVRETKRIRSESGQKLRGRQTDDKEKFCKVIHRTYTGLDIAFGHHNQKTLEEVIQGHLNRMNIGEVEQVLNDALYSIASLETISQIARKKRDVHYENLSAGKK